MQTPAHSASRPAAGSSATVSRIRFTRRLPHPKKRDSSPSAATPPDPVQLADWTLGKTRRERSIAGFLSTGETEKPNARTLAASDLVITTYGMVARLDWPAETDWGWVIPDEAQAIKNHSSNQSKAVRKLKARARIAMTPHALQANLQPSRPAHPIRKLRCFP